MYNYKKIWIVVYPVLISLLMEHLIGMTDTAFLGRVGEVELGASALAGVYYMAIFMLGFGFSIGSQIMIARRNGEKEYSKIGPLFNVGILFMLCLATIIFLVSKQFSPVILHQLIDSEQVYEATMKYMNWRVYGFFFSFTAVLFRAFYVGTTKTKILTINSVVMVLSNVMLNYLLIFGKFGFPQLGIAGAAIASSAAECVSVLFFVIYTLCKVDWKKYGLFNFTGLQPRLLGHMLNISIWTMIQSFISLSTWFLFFIAVEHLGERSLAITNIVRNISALPFMMVGAFATTSSSLISNLIGGGKQDQVLPLCWKIIKMSYLFVLPLALLFLFFPEVVLRIYTDNPELIASSVASLRVMTTSYLFSVPGFILFQSVSGTGNTRAAMLMEFATLIVYVAYMVYIVIYLKADVAVCWTTEHVYAAVILTFTYFYMKKGSWKYKKI